mmetsp:Transcript_14177/g.23447  ORF Transcript_14177/g.23447 Transcript_14177/m.23447 type:complete len:332 (+) Transcript_14177:3-998(+)
MLSHRISSSSVALVGSLAVKPIRLGRPSHLYRTQIIAVFPLMGRKDGSSTSGRGGFRNPHNLPVKTCVVCDRPFTWRKKWEKCWDEVLTCSQSCKSKRRSSGRAGGAAGAVAAAAVIKRSSGKPVANEEEASGVESCEESDDLAGADLVDHQSAQNESDAPTCLNKDHDAQEPKDTVIADDSETEQQLSKALELLIEGSNADNDANDDADDGASAQAPLSKEEKRRAHKQSVKAMKAERRAHRTGAAHAGLAKQKPCGECSKQVDLLVRCTTDESQQWRMLCGRCWAKASGGVPDGDADHPHYRYGGLWKNRAATIKMPSFAPQPQECVED